MGIRLLVSCGSELGLSQKQYDSENRRLRLTRLYQLYNWFIFYFKVLVLRFSLNKLQCSFYTLFDFTLFLYTTFRLRWYHFKLFVVSFVFFKIFLFRIFLVIFDMLPLIPTFELSKWMFTSTTFLRIIVFLCLSTVFSTLPHLLLDLLLGSLSMFHCRWSVCSCRGTSSCEPIVEWLHRWNNWL